jgi:large subunit ribosomal protein L20
VKRGVTKRQRHKRFLKAAAGHYSVRHRQYKRARESTLHAGMYAYAHRRERKGDFRKLWILRVGAASSSLGISYSRFIHGLKQAGVDINRKILADLAVRDPDTFAQLAEKARQGLAAA